MRDIPMISYNEEPTVNDVAAQNVMLSNMAGQDGHKVAANYQHEKETGLPSQFWQMADNQNIHKVFDPEALHPKLVDLIAGNPDKVSYFKDDLPVWNKIMDALDKLPNKNEQRPVPQNGAEEDSTWWNNLVPNNPIPGLREAADKIGALAYDTIRSAADAVNPFVVGENMSLADREKLSERTDKLNRVNGLMRIMFGYLTEEQFKNTSDEDLQRAFTELGKIHDIRTDDLSVADFRNLPYLEGVKPSELINFFGAIEGGKAIERIVNPELRPENLANVDETSPVYLQLAKLQALEEENEMLRGISKASEVTNGVLMSLRLMAEIAATGGTSKAVQAAGQTGFREIYHAAGVPGVINKFGSNLVKGLWGIAKQNAKRLPLFAAQGAAEAYNQDYLGGVVSVIDENGAHVEASEPELKDFWLGLMTHMFEHANEMATEELGELLPLNQLSYFVPKRVRNAIIARLGMEPMTRNVVYTWIKKHVPITGATGEWTEEEIANFNSRAATIILEEVNKFFGNDTPITPGTENWTILFGDKRERDVTAMSLLAQQALFGGAIFIGNYARGYRPHPFRPLEARARFMREKESINEVVDRLPHTPLLNSPAATEAVLDSAVGDAAWVIPFEEADALMQQANSDDLSTEDKEDMKGALNAMGITEKAVENAKKNGRDLILSRNAVISTMSHGNFKTARDLGNKIMENAVNAEYGVFGAKNIEVTKDTFNKKMLEEMDRIAAEQAEFGVENIQTIRNAIEKARADEEERAKAEGRAPNVMRESFTKSLDGYYSLMNCIMRYLWVGGKAEAKAAVKDMIEKLSFRFAENPEQFNLQKAYADTEATVRRAKENGDRLGAAEARYREALAKFGEEEKKQQERQKADPNAVDVDQSYTDAYNELQESINELNLARKEADAAKTAQEAPVEEPLNQIIGRRGLENIHGVEQTQKFFDEAEAMEKAGDSEWKIWSKTGLQRGADGEWRAEIPDIMFNADADIDFENDQFALMNWYGDIVNNNWSLQSLVHADELFDAYPQLRNLKVRFADIGSFDTKGMYRYEDRTIYLNRNAYNHAGLADKMEYAAMMSQVDDTLQEELKSSAEQMLSTLAHEIQHAIQHIEGFARGSNTKEMDDRQDDIDELDPKWKRLQKSLEAPRKEWYKKARAYKAAVKKAGLKLIDENGYQTEYSSALDYTDDARTLLSELEKSDRKTIKDVADALREYIKVEEKMDEIFDEMDKLSKDYFNRYQRVAGEVEARNVQNRMKIPFLERIGIMLSDTERVGNAFIDRADQIVLNQQAVTNQLNALKDASSMTKEVAAADNGMADSEEVTDEETLSWLNSLSEDAKDEDKRLVRSTRWMQLIDGELYPVMNEKVASSKSAARVPPTRLGVWTKAAEHPEKAFWTDSNEATDAKRNRHYWERGVPLEKQNPKGHTWWFELSKTTVDKDGKEGVSSVVAKYAPFNHSSEEDFINDQFTIGYKRPNVVLVEGVFPLYELNHPSGDSLGMSDKKTGRHPWNHKKTLAQLGPHNVTLTKYFKAERILSPKEAAEKMAGMFKDHPDVTVTWNVVPPPILKELLNTKIPGTDKYVQFMEATGLSKAEVQRLADTGYLDELRRRGTPLWENKDGTDVLFQVSPVWTGSAANYDQPSLQYVGTGEGAQVFGWGLYGSSDEEVARWYANKDVDRKKRLIPQDSEVMVRGENIKLNRSVSIGDILRKYYPDDAGKQDALEAIIYASIAHPEYDIEKLVPYVKKMLNYNTSDKERLDNLYNALSSVVEEVEIKPVIPNGDVRRNLYKQTFWSDKEENLLDWGKRVSTEQIDAIKKQAKKEGVDASRFGKKKVKIDGVRLSDVNGGRGTYDITLLGDEYIELTVNDLGEIESSDIGVEGETLASLLGVKVANKILDFLEEEDEFKDLDLKRVTLDIGSSIYTGKKLYEELAAQLGSPKAASEFLYRAGIDGVTYIGDSSGARNYVAFNDADIRVDEHILFQGARAATYGVSNIEKFAQSHEALMVLFRTADASTLPHESAHWLLAAMRALVSEGLGTEKMEQDLKTIDDWLAKQEYTEAAARRQGILHIGEDGKEYFDRKEMEQEYFARAFESYLLEGKLPETATSKLKTALRRLVEFFRAIYDDAKKLDVQMDPSITQFFDRIVAADYVSENHSVMSDILQAINEGALGMSNEELSNLEKALGGVREDAEAEKWLAALKAYLKGVKELTPDWKREANAAYDASKIEKAFVYVKGAGHKLYEGFLRENGFSEETIKTLRDKGLTVKNPYRGSKGPATDTATQTSAPYVVTETDEEFAKRWKEIPGDLEVTVTDEDMLGKIIYATMSGVEGRMLNKTAYTPSEYIGAVFDKLKKAELKPSSKKELMSLIWITADNLVRDDREKASRRNEVSADETQEDEEGNERSNGGGYGEAKSNAINQVGNADKEDFGLQKLLTDYVNGIKDSTKRRVAGAAASILIRKVLENGETEIKTADVIEEYKRLFGSNKNAQRSDDTLSEIWNGKNNGTGIKFQIARVLRESMQRQNELRQTPQGSTEAPQYIMKTLQDLGYETVDDLVADLLMAKGKDAFIDDFMAQKLEEYKRAFMESPEWNSDAGATLYLDAILNALQLTKDMKFSQRVAAETYKAEREMKAEKTVGEMLKLQTVRGIETSLKASVARLLKTIKTNKENREAAVKAAVEVHRLAAQLKVARQLHTDVEKSIRKAKRFGKMKAGATIDGDALNAIKALNRHFGLSNAKPNWTTGEGDPRTPYEVVKEMVRLRAEPMRFENDTEKQAYIASVINGIMNQWSEKMQNAMYLQSNENRPNVEPFTNMKYDEFEELKHVLQFLYKASRDMMESVDGSFAADLKKRKEEIFNEMSANKTGDYSELDEVNGWEKTKSRVRSGLHIGKSMQWFAHLFSGYKEFYGAHDLGAFRKYFELPIAEGESKQYYWQQKISGEIKPHLEALMRSCNERGVSAKINSENAIRHGGYGATIKGKPMAFVLLNAGNLGNRQRLMSGFGWSEDELNGILRQFSEEDYKHADAIWASLAQLGMEMADVFYKERHYRMKHVDSAKIELTNYEGKTIISQGGYYPLAYKYSGVRSSEDFEIMNPPHRPEKMAAPSSTMDREERVEDRIVRLDWSVLNKHIHEGSRYVGLWEPLHMANAIFRDKQFYRSVTENFGREAYDVFAKLMEYVNNPDMRYKYGKLANRVASIMATTALGFKVTTMEKQWASLWVGVDRLGSAGYFTDAFQAFWSNPKKFVDDVSEISPFLRDRYNLLDRDLTVLDTEFKKPVEQVADRYRMLAFWGMKKMDLCVAAIQWKAAFDFAQNTYKDMTISMCRAWADDFVASSQGAARTIDIPAVQLDAIGRMLTPFFGPACAAANTRIAGLSAFGKMDAGERISFAVENFVVPALMCAFIMAVANGLFRMDDDDDWDRVRRSFLRNLLAEPVSGIPFVQDVADAMVGVLVNGRASGRDVFEVGMLRPAEEMMSDAGKILVNIRNFDNLDQSLYIGARIAGEWFGMPVIQAGEDYEKMAIRNHFYPFENTIEKTLGDN